MSVVGDSVGVIKDVAKGIASIFKGKPVGDAGWQTYIKNAARPVGRQYYPSAAEILAANVTADPTELAAIASNYDQNTGIGTEGDWHFAVTSTNPIVLDWYKGDKEHFQTKATASFAAFASQSPIAQANVDQALNVAGNAAFGGTPPGPPPPSDSFKVDSGSILKWMGIVIGVFVGLVTLVKLLKSK